jgi:hypothetical protein
MVPLPSFPDLVLWLGCPRNSVDTEFRLFFFTSVYSVFRAELAKIPLNSVSYNSMKFRGISRNSVTFFMYGILYISNDTHVKVSSNFLVEKVHTYGTLCTTGTGWVLTVLVYFLMIIFGTALCDTRYRLIVPSPSSNVGKP